MAERKDLTEGQEVRVYGASRRGGIPGWVRRIGRTVVDIDYAGSYKPVGFYMETQQMTGKSYGYGVWFKTMDQVALSERKEKALETLKQYGLGPLGWGQPKASLDVLEAAAEAVLQATEDL